MIPVHRRSKCAVFIEPPVGTHVGALVSAGAADHADLKVSECRVIGPAVGVKFGREPTNLRTNQERSSGELVKLSQGSAFVPSGRRCIALQFCGLPKRNLEMNKSPAPLSIAEITRRIGLFEQLLRKAKTKRERNSLEEELGRLKSLLHSERTPDDAE